MNVDEVHILIGLPADDATKLLPATELYITTLLQSSLMVLMVLGIARLFVWIVIDR